MAAPTNVTVPQRRLSMDEANDLLFQVVTQLNLLTGAVRAVANKLDADAGVTDTNYFSTILDAAGTNPAKQITLVSGL